LDSALRFHGESFHFLFDVAAKMKKLSGDRGHPPIARGSPQRISKPMVWTFLISYDFIKGCLMRSISSWSCFYLMFAKSHLSWFFCLCIGLRTFLSHSSQGRPEGIVANVALIGKSLGDSSSIFCPAFLPFPISR
jgi:hypothetical protein